MTQVDVAIIGGGLAGSTAAAVLGRQGISVAVIDSGTACRSELRCEKVNSEQRLILKRLLLDNAVASAGTLDHAIWTARFGKLIGKKSSAQLGLPYHALVGAISREIPSAVIRLQAKATALSTSGRRQRVALDTGGTVDARLVIVASGLSANLLEQTGMQRTVMSKTHCVTFGFDVAPLNKSRFAFPALTYFSERPSDQTAYLTLFPMRGAMRANLFVYRHLDDPLLRQMRADPTKTLQDLLPGINAFTGGLIVTGDVQVRPVDLYKTSGCLQPGIVLIGDAFATSCPAAGTGATKVYTDVERLCTVHIPRWLATPGMAQEKIGQFYSDPIKQACDRRSEAAAFHFRAVSTGTGWSWHIRRIARFHIRRWQGLLHRGCESFGLIGSRLRARA